jgi:hypothetical protein
MGDCQRIVCNSVGVETSEDFPADLSDNNECTALTPAPGAACCFVAELAFG